MGGDADAAMSSLLCSSGARKCKKQPKAQKYLRPGALAQLRDARINNTRAYCPAIGRKRILVVDFDGPPKIKSTTTSAEGDDLAPPNKMLSTPKTPKIAVEQPQHTEVESRLESLPIDLLVIHMPFSFHILFFFCIFLGSIEASFSILETKGDLQVRILCLLHHDELKSVFHVSQRIRKVAVMARQCYFNYTTPDRSRQVMLKLTARCLDEQWPFLGGAGSDRAMLYPTTPKAPKHNQRPPLRLSVAEMRQISASLFQGSPSRSHNKKRKPPGLHRLASRAQPSSRALFYEEELCQAVAQNTLR